MCSNTEEIPCAAPLTIRKFFGGWGCLVTATEEPPLVNNTATPPSIGIFLANAGYHADTEYLSVLQHPIIPPSTVDYPNIVFVEKPIGEIVQDGILMGKIQALMVHEFNRFLPDVSMGDEFHHIVSELLGIGNGEDFITIALDSTMDAIAGMILNIPNMFDLWSGYELHSADVNTVIIAKDYRWMDFFHFLYAQAARKATARGIDRKIGTCILVREYRRCQIVWAI